MCERKQKLPFRKEQALVKPEPIAINPFFSFRIRFHDRNSLLKVSIFYTFALDFKSVTSELWEIYLKYSRWGKYGEAGELRQRGAASTPPSLGGFTLLDVGAGN